MKFPLTIRDSEGSQFFREDLTFLSVLPFQRGGMSLSDSQKKAVADIFGRYADAYRNKDAPALRALFSPDITGFGSGVDEIIGNRDQLAGSGRARPVAG